MANFPNARISFGAIMDAIRLQLVADNVALLQNIVWGSPNNHPVLSGSSDIMMVARGFRHEPMDGGPAQFQGRRLVDIWIRGQPVIDPGTTLEAYLRATFIQGDQVLASVGCDGFWPEDSDGNLLTVEAIKAVEDQPPDYKVAGNVYGDLICTLEVIYMPAIDPASGIFPS